MKIRNLVVAILILCTLAAGILGAQNKKRQEDEATRSVQGVVTDANGSPVAGAVVQLKDTKTLQVRSFITKEDGAYHFHGLSTNVDYELKAEFQGTASAVKTLSVF